MRKLFLFVTACLLTCATQTVKADDYTFDLRTLEIGGEVVSPYTETTIPQDGVNIFVRTRSEYGVGMLPVNLYAWKHDGTKLLGDFPGLELHSSNLKYVTTNDNEGNKVSYYYYHFDKSILDENLVKNPLGVVFKVGSNQCSDIFIYAEGNYFYNFVGYNNNVPATNETSNYVSGGERIIPATGTNVFVREMNNDNNTYNNNAEIWLHAWNADHADLLGGWPGLQMTDYIYMDGVKWFYWHTDNTSWGGIVFSQNGSNQTVDINNSEPNKAFGAGDNFYTYKPFEKQWDVNKWCFAVENDKQYFQNRIPLKDRTANFKVWTYNEVALNNQIVMTDPENKFRLTFTLGSGKSVNDIQFDKTNGRLELPQYSTIKVESLTDYCLNEVILGPLTTTIAWGIDDNYSTNPKEDDHIHDWIQAGESENTPDYYYLANFFRDVVVDQKELTVGGNQGSGLKDGTRFIGPKIYVRNEAIASDKLTFADHNVKQAKHFLTDDLVGVDVFEGYLICRSVTPISDEYKHKPVAGQKILKVNGSTPAYADPATPQYSWIALKIDNPSSLIGAQLHNVRGTYCGDVDNDHSHHGWMNPTMKVDSYEKVAEGVTTTLNTYCVANFSEQKKENKNGYTPKYFYMEPRHWEICNVTDVMRTPNQVVYAPTENALFPADKSNYYPRQGVAGSAALKDFEAAWAAVDEVTGANYLTYNHVFNIEHAIALTQDWNQTNDTDYDYPLNTPNPTYDQECENDYHFFLWGMPDTKINREVGYTDQNFATADLVYFSRYDVQNNLNAYKNDLRIMVNNPSTDLSAVKDLAVTRRDRLGDNPVTIATLARQGEGQYKVVYNNETQTITNNVDDILQKGDTHYTNPDKVYNLKSTDENDPNIIFLSDRFVSNILTGETDITNQNDYFQYRVEPIGETPDWVTCVVHGVPVYKTNNYGLTRAEYEQSDVDGDTDRHLTEDANVSIEFTASRPTDGYCADMYNVWRGENTTDLSKSSIEGALDMQSVWTKEFEANDTYNSPVNFYVPVQWTEYNDNTYGTYKREISDASVYIDANDVMASTVAHNDGSRWCHANVTVVTTIDKTEKDSRYLVRVWREQNGALTLLNTLNDLTGSDFYGDGYNWETNYSHMAMMGKQNEEEFNNTQTIQFTINDTFIAKPRTAGAPAIGLKADNGNFDMEDVNYYITLYVRDDATDKYYVKTQAVPVKNSIPTGISTVKTGAQVESVRYYNTIGVESSEPFKGVNIVVTRYSNGTTTTTKMIR